MRFRPFLITCTICRHKAHIYKSETITDEFKKFYLECLNPDCKHRFVSNLSYSHTLSEPDNKLDNLLDKIRNLTKEQQEQVKLALS